MDGGTGRAPRGRELNRKSEAAWCCVVLDSHVGRIPPLAPGVARSRCYGQRLEQDYDKAVTSWTIADVLLPILGLRYQRKPTGLHVAVRRGPMLAQSGHRLGWSGMSAFRGKADILEEVHRRLLLTRNRRGSGWSHPKLSAMGSAGPFNRALCP